MLANKQPNAFSAAILAYILTTSAVKEKAAVAVQTLRTWNQNLKVIKNIFVIKFFDLFYLVMSQCISIRRLAFKSTNILSIFILMV